MRQCFIVLACIANVARGASYTIDENGINSKSTGLTGQGIVIGQIEGDRPGKPGHDMDADNYHPQTVPVAVYAGTITGSVVMDSADSARIHNHATGVAGIMIASAQPFPIYEGVAPQAELHSVATLGDPTLFASHLDFLARRPGMLAINMSATFPISELEGPDGNSTATMAVDWVSRVRDVLFVTSGEYSLVEPTGSPADNYNGITVGASASFEEDDLDPVYRQTWSETTTTLDAAGDRVSVDILAPGWQIRRTNNTDELDLLYDGTSSAAPHVTGAAALLGQFAAQQTGWDLDNARQHQVLKAIILNSADKLSGVHGSQRTVINLYGNDWLDTVAYINPSIPIDETMGAGHLNVQRAVNNYKAGEQIPTTLATPTTVANRGWDFNEIGGVGAFWEYPLESALEERDWVAATLAWDRMIDGTNSDEGPHQPSDQFFPENPAANISALDLYLVPTGTANFRTGYAARSIASLDTIEHIFFEIESAGFYSIIVDHAGGAGSGEDAEYGLAWWAGEFADPRADFDNDGDVDGQDLDAWEDDFGTNGVDADGDGFTDGGDFLVWQREFGLGVPALAAVPEPSTWALLALGALVISLRASQPAARRR